MLGPIAPDTFIPLAEESGPTAGLGRLGDADGLRPGPGMADPGLPAVRMAVNLSGRAFWRSRIVERVTEVLALTGVNPKQLELEVTESMAVDAVTDRPGRCSGSWRPSVYAWPSMTSGRAIPPSADCRDFRSTR